MTDVAFSGPTEVAAEPTVTVIRSTPGLASLQLAGVWQYRELLFFLAWRDVKVRYKQTALGITWIILQPLLSTVIFTVIFGGLLNVPSYGVPYALFALTALVPWQYFAGSLSRVGGSLVASANLISKVYFPRLIIPLSGVISTLVDFAVGFVALLVLVVVFRQPITARVLTLPFFLFWAVLIALGFGLWLAALNVRYRDVNYLIPFLLQIWMYITPVVYGAALIPEQFRWLMALNPMTGVVTGFRWAFLGGPNPLGSLGVLSLVVTVLVLVSGLIFFPRNGEDLRRYHLTGRVTTNVPTHTNV